MSQLENLPAELLLRTTEYLPFDDVRSFSAANIQFRELVAPSLFRSVRVTNETGSCDGLSTFAENFGKHVKKITFACHLRPNADDSELDSAPSEGGWHEASEDSTREIERLPQPIVDLLSGGTLPDVNSMRIIFTAEGNYDASDSWDGGNGDGLGSIHIHAEAEGAEDVDEKESEHSWRAIVNQTLSSVALNQAIEDFDIVDLFPKLNSVYRKAVWRQFLGRLKHFRLELWGGDNGAGWHSNTMPGYSDFIKMLNKRFLSKLTAARRVIFVADVDNPVGCKGMRHSPLPFMPGDMPAIEYLELWHCFVDPALLDFFEAKAQQLKSLRLIDCYSAGTADVSSADNPRSWADVFARIRKADSVLQELSVVNQLVPLCETEAYPPEPAEEDEPKPDNVIAIRETLRLDSGRRLFPYVHLDDKYGMVFTQEETNIEQFEQGKDQKEYDALMELVKANRVAASLPPEHSALSSDMLDKDKRQRKLRRGTHQNEDG